MDPAAVDNLCDDPTVITIIIPALQIASFVRDGRDLEYTKDFFVDLLTSMSPSTFSFTMQFVSKNPHRIREFMTPNAKLPTTREQLKQMMCNPVECVPDEDESEMIVEVTDNYAVYHAKEDRYIRECQEIENNLVYATSSYIDWESPVLEGIEIGEPLPEEFPIFKIQPLDVGLTVDQNDVVSMYNTVFNNAKLFDYVVFAPDIKDLVLGDKISAYKTDDILNWNIMFPRIVLTDKLEFLKFGRRVLSITSSYEYFDRNIIRNDDPPGYDWYEMVKNVSKYTNYRLVVDRPASTLVDIVSYFVSGKPKMKEYSKYLNLRVHKIN